MDRGTFNTLQRDMGARREGAQRSRDFSTYSNRGGNAGSYRGGGMSRGVVDSEEAVAEADDLYLLCPCNAK